MTPICSILEAIRYNDVVPEAMTQIPRIYNCSYAQCLLIMKEKIQIQTWKLDTRAGISIDSKEAIDTCVTFVASR